MERNENLTNKNTTPENVCPENVMLNDSLLQFLLTKCNISLEDAKSEIENMNNKKYLEKHSFNIWQGTDGRWRTYLPDDKQKTSGNS